MGVLMSSAGAEGSFARCDLLNILGDVREVDPNKHCGYKERKVAIVHLCKAGLHMAC